MNYKNIKQIDGSLDDVVVKLHELYSVGIRACYEFNGTHLFSDMTIDEAYIAVLGLDKADYDRIMQSEIEAKSHASETGIKKFDEVMVRGDNVIPEQFRISLHDMACTSLTKGYGCKEFDCTFAVIEALENGATLEDAKEILDNSQLTDEEKELVSWEVQELSTRGDSFYEYTINGVDIEQTGPIIGNN